MRCGRPGAGGGAAFVGLPASVINAARKRAASGGTDARPVARKRSSATVAQTRNEPGSSSGTTLGDRASRGLAWAPATGCGTGCPVPGARPAALFEPTPIQGGGTAAAGPAPPEGALRPPPGPRSVSAQEETEALVRTAPSSELRVLPRRDMPEVKPFASASRERALQMTLSESNREEAMARLEHDMLANSSHASTESKLRLYREFHESWFGPEPSWLPLTPSSVIAVGAMLKAGHYSSGANYISAARVESRNRGYAEHPLLAHTVRKVVVSIERGVGQQKQTQALPLERLGELPGGDEAWCKHGPTGAADALIVGSWWLMRELELASLDFTEVVVNTALKQAEIRLSCSKSDCKAVGRGRTHGCSCDADGPEVEYCPFHSVMRHRQRVLRLFPEAEAVEAFPFFPTTEGGRVTKAAFQQSVELAATMLGLPTRGPRGEAFFTGHVCRRTGAEALTAAGVDVPTVQIFGRWGKSTVMRYCLEAPLAGSAQFASRLRRPRASGLSEDHGEVESLRLAVRRLEAQMEEQRNEVSAITLDTIQALQDVGDTQELAPVTGDARKILNLDFDRHGRERHEIAGVVHIVRVLDEGVPVDLWKTRCGWKFGKKKKNSWRLLEKDEGLSAYGICERCIGRGEN